METVQQSVVRLEHGMPAQAQMAYAQQRSSALHRTPPQSDSSPYKSQSPGRQSSYTYPGGGPREPPNMRYVQSTYGGAVPYRDPTPYAVRNADRLTLHPPNQPPPTQPPAPQQQVPPPPQQQSQQQSQPAPQQQQATTQQQAPQPPAPQPQPPPQQQTPASTPQQQSTPQQPAPQQPSQVEYIREAPQVRNRISLLPPQEYLSSLGRNRLQAADQYRDGFQLDVGQPFKKMRMGEAKPDVQQPLRIDTREQPAYNPQVEAISPTLPSDSMQEDASFRSTKDELLQQIGKVDREIAKAESQIAKLKKKQQELEEVASKPAVQKEEEEIAAPKHQSLAQKIYAENRKRAQEAHSLLEKLGPKVDLPLYNQPSDTAVYHENKRKYLTFKSRLMEYFKRRHVERESREKYMTATYSRLMQEWLRKVEKIEAMNRRKFREARNREFFEKVFPELRKQREDRERFNRVGARIKSEADLEEIMDSLQEQEMEDKKMRSYAVVPPILLDSRQRRMTYVNNNGRIEDFAAEYKERQLLNVWTDSEREIFKEKYLQHPKNFGVIGSYLERKSVCDCVQYYYLSKKTENYKQLLRKSRQRTRASRNNPHGKPSNATQNNLQDILSGPTGVTTRLQREQQQKQEQPSTGSGGATSNSTSLTTSTGTPTVSTSTVAVPLSTPSSSAANEQTPPSTVTATTITSSFATSGTTTVSTSENPTVTAATTTTTALPAIPTVASCTTASSSPTTNSGTVATSTISSSPIGNTNSNNNNSSAVDKDQHLVNDKTVSEGKLESKKKERRKEDKKKKNNEEMETSDEEIVDTQEKGGVHPCAVCKTTLEQFLQSRPLPHSHAAQYGLREDQVPAGARVCNTCRCKAVRSRYTQCPLPTCPNAKGRVKRLRPLPGRWTELPAEVRDPVVAEFQIPPTVSKCCSACFNRISRRLAPHLQDGSVCPEDEGGVQPHLRWTEDETEVMKRALREHGMNWSKVAERVGSTKTQHQCKNFYFNYRKKLGLDLLVQEYNKNHLGEERKPTVTDEEESGSSTSSCDEVTGMQIDNSDTDSASSPTTREQSDKAEANTVPPSEGASVKVNDHEMTPVVATNGNGSSSSNVASSSAEVRPQTQGQQADYDSSATETADEGQGGNDGDGSVASRQSPSKNIAASSTVSISQSQPTELNGTGSSLRESASPSNVRSVKDLMLGVIEMTLKKTPGGQAVGNAVTPTISSILNTDHRSDITFVREFRPDKQRLAQESNLATLSVVNSHGSLHQQPPTSILQHMPQMQATITPCLPPGELPKEGLVVVQVQQAMRESREPEPETLDLSLKKPRECSPVTRDPSRDSPYHHHPQHRDSPSLPPHTTLHTVPPPAHSKMVHPHTPALTVYRTSGHSTDSGYYPQQVVVSQDQLRNVNKAPSVFLSAVPHPDRRGDGGPTPHLVMNQQQSASRVPPPAPNSKMAKVTPPPLSSKLSPKLPLAGVKGGSITHGTPVSSASLMVGGPTQLHQMQQPQQQRYEGLLRQTTPPQPHGKEGPPMGGSITQGTPVHHPPHHLGVEKRGDRAGLAPVPYEYYKRMSPAGQSGGGGSQPSGYLYSREAAMPQTTVAPGGFTSPYPHQQPRPPASYEQQLSSRQIIMSDYITSQQMHGPRRVSTGSGSTSSSEKVVSQQDSSSPRGVSSSPHYYSNANVGQSVYMTPDVRLSRPPSANAPTMEQSPTPPHHTPPPPARQGVIQRHNTVPAQQSRPPSGGSSVTTKPPSPAASPHQRLHHQHHQVPHHYQPPPGHEAFSSLVEMAVQQPSLPVPDKRVSASSLGQRYHVHPHEGLGKTMADSLSGTRILSEHHDQEQRFAVTREREQREAHHSEQQQQRYLTVRERDGHGEQQRFGHHQERFVPSMREREQEQQRFARERDRDLHHLQIQQQQQQQQQMLRQQQQQQQQQQQARMAAAAEFDHQRQQQQQQRHHRSQMAAAYREHQRTGEMEREPARMMPSSFPRDVAPVPRHHAPPPQQPGPPPTSHAAADRESGSAGAGRGRSLPGGSNGDSLTMTTANLIDALVTHSINQSATDTGGNSLGASSTNQTPQRPGDRLFQSFHRDQPPPSAQQQPQQSPSEANGKTSPLKSSQSPTVHLDHGKPSSQESSSNPKSIREHIHSIINNDYSSNPPSSGYPQMHHRAMYTHVPYHMVPPPDAMAEHHSRKLRLALQQQEAAREREQWEREKSQASSRSGTPSGALQSDERQIIRIAQPASPRGPNPSAGPKQPSGAPYHVEPVSPPETAPGNHHWLPGGGTTPDSMAFLMSRRHPQEPSHISALDYVNNKIVEVMRTEDEKPQQQRHHQTHYPGKQTNNSEDKSEQEETSQPEAVGKDKEHCDSPGEMVIDEGTGQGQSTDGKLDPGGKVTSLPHSSPSPATKSMVLSPAYATAEFVPTSTTYAYPFSALNVLSAAHSPGPGSAPTGQPSTVGQPPSSTSGAVPSQGKAQPLSSAPRPGSPSAPEPAPLLSAQYEPLSDED